MEPRKVEFVLDFGSPSAYLAETFIPEVERRMTEEGLTHPLIHRLAGRLTTRAAACRKLLRG